MPFSAKTFASRHNKKLTPGQAGKAAGVANAMIREGEPEGLAIATANARAKGQKPKKHAKPFGSLAP